MARRKRRKTSASAANTLQVKAGCPLSEWDGDEGHCHWCNAELVGRQRSWCSSTCRRAFERNHVWSIARAAAKRRARYRCQTCGSNESLEVNHIDPVLGAGYGLSCRHHQENLEVLCHACHVQVTSSQRESRRSA